mgnify:FL=1
MRKKYRSFLFYTITLTIFFLLMYGVVLLAEYNIEHPEELSHVSNGLSAWKSFLKALGQSMQGELSILILQIAVILLAVKIFGWICLKIGQPSVVGEIIAGVVLGPSLLGLYFPEVSDFIFPVSSLGNIGFLSQIGLILFMFIVGLELNFKTIQKRANDAVIISHASIVLPFALGFILAYFMYEEFSPHNIPFMSFALFMGIAMSITAFPVLARIVHERGINKTALGPIVITCAAIDDITAWCILAAVIAIVKAGSFTSSIFVIIIAIIYVLFMLKVLRPVLRRMAENWSSKKIMSRSMILVYCLILFLSSYATEIIGIHALFGAFIAGVVMPTNMNFRENLTQKIEDVALVIFLPLFFVYTGLRTEIGLLNDVHLWLVCLAIIAVAVVGKFFGSALSARFVGLNKKDSTIIGILMNTRGLMELVVLNIGHDLGVLIPEVFAMMVVMALVTTFMTSPLLNVVDKIFKKTPDTPLLTHKDRFNILISFEDTDMGRKLLYLANAFVKKYQKKTDVTMLHISEGSPLYQYGLDKEEKDIFKPIIDEARGLKQDIIPIFKIANNTHAAAVKYANKGEFDFMLIGHRKSILSDNLLGKMIKFTNRMIHIPNHLVAKLGAKKSLKQSITAPFDEGTRYTISRSDMPTGVLIDRNMILDIRSVFVPIFDEDDAFVGDFVKRLAENSQVKITLWDSIDLSNQSIEFTQAIRAARAANPYHYQLWNNIVPIDFNILQKHDLVLISLNSWKKLISKDEALASHAPSILVLTN